MTAISKPSLLETLNKGLFEPIKQEKKALSAYDQFVQKVDNLKILIANPGGFIQSLESKKTLESQMCSYMIGFAVLTAVVVATNLLAIGTLGVIGIGSVVALSLLTGFTFGALIIHEIMEIEEKLAVPTFHEIQVQLENLPHEAQTVLDKYGPAIERLKKRVQISDEIQQLQEKVSATSVSRLSIDSMLDQIRML
ncbi:MAG: hypothetical protein K2X08_06315 [Chlamydiales bacterium]|nr:hypothetical protein [Chlamydiales bacterium]